MYKFMFGLYKAFEESQKRFILQHRILYLSFFFYKYLSTIMLITLSANTILTISCRQRNFDKSAGMLCVKCFFFPHNLFGPKNFTVFPFFYAFYSKYFVCMSRCKLFNTNTFCFIKILTYLQ